MHLINLKYVSNAFPAAFALDSCCSGFSQNQAAGNTDPLVK